MESLVILNPGSGPVAGDVCLDYAIANVTSFIEDLGMKNPSVAVTMRSSKHDGTGRYSFDLHRGIRTVDVDMPGVALDEIRCTKGFGLSGRPRLYVDGNSWWWCYALDMARIALEDHDGAVEQLIKVSEQTADAELDRQPRCAACNSVRSLVIVKDLYEARCYTCAPKIETWRETPVGAVYHDDSWRRATHYFVRRQHMSPEVPGHEDPRHPDALCGARFDYDRCRRKRGHEGRCEPYWKEIERTCVLPDLEASR